MNHRNYHTINIEVTTIHHLGWLEDHIEVKKNSNDEATLNIIAFDK
jgi:hypothetical protein